MEKYCFLPAADNYNTIGNLNNIIFHIKYTKLYVLFITLSAKDHQTLSKLLSKEFERSVYLIKFKTKTEHKNTKNEYRFE